MTPRAVEPMHAGCIGDEDRIGPADEEPAFDHSDNAPDALLQPRWIGNGTEAAVENAISTVGDEGAVCLRQAQPGARAQSLESRLGCFQPECHDLHGNWGARTESIHQLPPVNDNGEAPTGRRDDLLAQQGTAQAFDQIERAPLHLVRTVDGEVDLPVLREGSEWDTPRPRLRGR